MQITRPERIKDPPTTVPVRSGARNAALDSIRKALKDDIAEGRISTLQDAVTHLRLSESEPTAPLPDDEGKKLLEAFYERFPSTTNPKIASNEATGDQQH